MYQSSSVVDHRPCSCVVALLQDVKNHGKLAAEGEQHARNLTERDRFMRRIAAQTGIMQLPGQSSILTQTLLKPYSNLTHNQEHQASTQQSII